MLQADTINRLRTLLYDVPLDSARKESRDGNWFESIAAISSPKCFPSVTNQRSRPAPNLRAVHVVPAISEEASGPSYSVPKLCEALIASGVDVTLLTLAWSIEDRNLSYLRTFPLGILPRRLGSSPQMFRWLAQTAKSDTQLIIHNHGMWQMNSLYPGWIAHRHQCRLVISPRGAFSERAMSNGSYLKMLFWALLQRPALGSVACFHATAEEEFQDIRRLGFKQPVAIIPNGIDVPDHIGPRGARYSKRTLLFLGRIHKIKGLDLLLPAWTSVQARFPDWRLVIAGHDAGYTGSSGYLADMRTLAQQVGAQRVEFIGAVHGDAKWATYRQADLFVLPTYSENFGMAVAEALANEVPAIVTRGAPWAGLAERRAGWWVDISSEALGAALADAMSRPPMELMEMGSRGRQWMLEEYPWSRIGERMATVYRWLSGQIEDQPDCIRID